MPIVASKNQGSSNGNWLLVLALTILFFRSALDPILQMTKIGFGASSIGLGAFINVALVGVSLPLFLRRRDLLPFGPLVAWILFLAYAALMTLGATDFVYAARMIAVLISYFCWFMLPFLIIKKVDDARALFGVVVYSSFIPFIIAVAELLSHGLGGEGIRIQGTFTHPNIFAFYILIVITTVFCQLSSKSIPVSPIRRTLLIIYTILLSVLLVYTKTRSAWLCGAMLLAFYALFINRWGFLAMACLPIVGLMSPSIQARLMDLGMETTYIGHGVIMNSFELRKDLWTSASEWIMQRPLSGHGGFGSFRHFSPEIFEWTGVGLEAHNVFVQLSFEIGIVGAVLFLGIFIQLIWMFAASFRFDRALVALGIIVCAIYLALAMSDNLMSYLAFNWYFWALVGTIASWLRIQRLGWELKYGERVGGRFRVQRRHLEGHRPRRTTAS